VLEPTTVTSAVDAALSQLESRDGIEVQVPPGLRVVAHEATLTQIIYNLLSNALKFHAPGQQPRVLITARDHDSTVGISITDNGIGIDPAHHQRIFNVFERLHGTETYAGTGIGLAIVKRGIERMGGRIGIESKLGSGSTFWLELPSA
jgi:signal transduction histidine kinase